MDSTLLSVALVVAGASLVAALGVVAWANLRLVVACAQTMRAARQSHAEAYREAVGAMGLNYERLFAMVERDEVGRVLRRDGVLPHLLAPEEKVEAEIVAIMGATGMNHTQACGWMAISGEGAFAKEPERASSRLEYDRASPDGDRPGSQPT